MAEATKAKKVLEFLGQTALHSFLQPYFHPVWVWLGGVVLGVCATALTLARGMSPVPAFATGALLALVCTVIVGTMKRFLVGTTPRLTSGPSTSVLTEPLQQLVPAEAKAPNEKIISPTLLSHVCELDTPVSLPGIATVYTARASVGNVIELYNEPLSRMRIEVRNIVQYADNTYGAELYMPAGIDSVIGGEMTKKISRHCYYLPTVTAAFIDTSLSSLYFFHFSDKHARLFAVYVEHINPHSGVVTLKACRIFAGPPKESAEPEPGRG
jgi:hypothetical protein